MSMLDKRIRALNEQARLQPYADLFDDIGTFESRRVARALRGCIAWWQEWLTEAERAAEYEAMRHRHDVMMANLEADWAPR